MILTAILIIAMLAGLCAILIWKVFVVKSVSVKGNEIYTDKQIEDWVLDKEYSWNSLYVYFENKCEQNGGNPFCGFPSDTVKISAETGDYRSGKRNPRLSVCAVAWKKCIF